MNFKEINYRLHLFLSYFLFFFVFPTFLVSAETLPTFEPTVENGDAGDVYGLTKFKVEESGKAKGWDGFVESLPWNAVWVGFLKALSGKRLVGRCTGTFVGSNVLVTAAHCFDDLKESKMLFDEGTANFTLVSSGVSRTNDIAFVIFQRPIAPDWSCLTTSDFKKNEPARMFTYFDEDGSIILVKSPFRKFFYGVFHQKGILMPIGIDISDGDSGSPVYNNDGKLAGVVNSYYNSEDTKTTMGWPINETGDHQFIAVSLLSSNKGLIKRAQKLGANFYNID